VVEESEEDDSPEPVVNIDKHLKFHRRSHQDSQRMKATHTNEYFSASANIPVRRTKMKSFMQMTHPKKLASYRAVLDIKLKSEYAEEMNEKEFGKKRTFSMSMIGKRPTEPFLLKKIPATTENGKIREMKSARCTSSLEVPRLVISKQALRSTQYMQSLY